MKLDVVELVNNGNFKFEWSEVISTHNGYTLKIKVFRDAMKFDQIPYVNWKLEKLKDEYYSNIRLPASAHQLQQIADKLDCMLLTPKVIDLIWLQAKIKFDCITSIDGVIVANCSPIDVNLKINNKISEIGDNQKDLISCVGKYWCLTNELNYRGRLHGDWTACNYGWFSSNGSGPGISPGTKCFQRPGFRHNKLHWDPSQTIRLMSKFAKLIHPNGKEESVSLIDLASDPKLSYLFHHQGTLSYLRQKGVKEEQPLSLKNLNPLLWSNLDKPINL